MKGKQKRKIPIEIWFPAAAVIAAAIIAGVFELFGGTGGGKVKVRQETDSGNNSVAGRDGYQADRDNNNAQNGGTITTTTEAPVISVNQSGGITAGKVTIVNAIQLSLDPIDNAIEKKNNYQCVIDTINQVIYFQPKFGAWKNPFAGIPLGEYNIVQPRLSNQSFDVKIKSTKEFKVGVDTVYGREAVGTPATETFFYSLKYKKMPSYVIFGGYPDALYKVDLNKAFHKN